MLRSVVLAFGSDIPKPVLELFARPGRLMAYRAGTAWSVENVCAPHGGTENLRRDRPRDRRRGGAGVDPATFGLAYEPCPVRRPSRPLQPHRTARRRARIHTGTAPGGNRRDACQGSVQALIADEVPSAANLLVSARWAMPEVILGLRLRCVADRSRSGYAPASGRAGVPGRHPPNGARVGCVDLDRKGRSFHDRRGNDVVDGIIDHLKGISLVAAG